MSDVLRFLGVLGHERRRVLLSLLLNLVVTLGGVGVGVLGALAVGRAAVGRPLPVGALAWALGGTGVVIAAATWAESYVSHVFAYRVLALLRTRLYDAFALLVPAGLRRRRSGDLVTRVVGDVEALEWLFAHTVVQVVAALVVWVVGVVGTLWIDPALLFVVVPGAAAIAVVPVVFSRVADRQAEAVRVALGALKSDLVETVQGAPELTAAGAMRRRRARLSEDGAALAAAQRRHASRAGVETGCVDALLAGSGVAAVFVVSDRVQSASVDPATAAAAMVLVMAALGPASQIAGLVRQFGALRASLRRLIEVLDARPGTTFGPPQRLGAPPDRGRGVQVRGLEFAYPGGPPVLRGVDLDVPVGAVVALVGPSGCGKTTLVHLLLRLWRPDAGTIRVGGIDLADLTEADLRGFVAPVLQDVAVFHGSIVDNLRLGAPDASDADVAAACAAARLDAVIADLPEGLETVIGERGYGLSGGQRARLAIARALLTDAPVLLLDEAVAHLDPRLEEEIAAHLAGLRRRRAVLVVAHRRETIASADMVVRLDGGRARLDPEGTP